MPEIDPVNTSNFAYNFFFTSQLTIKGKSSFCPTLLKLQCGEHEQHTTLHETLWIDDGFGMMAMYKQDWINVGGIFFFFIYTFILFCQKKTI